MSSPTIIKWTTPGKILLTDGNGKPVSGPPPIEKGEIKITEEGNSFYLPDQAEAPIAGIPIDANLSVYLIKRIFDKLSKVIGEAGKGDTPALTVTEKWLIDLLLNSRAITIDKNSLLKTISQPGCEGVRFYLCTKPDTEEEEKDILSLVTIGVDKDGKDLGYEFDEAIANDIEINNAFKVPTKSLSCEYTYPPPPKTFSSATAKSTYIIGAYSWGDNYS